MELARIFSGADFVFELRHNNSCGYPHCIPSTNRGLSIIAKVAISRHNHAMSS
jgi:hypothetical protein